MAKQDKSVHKKSMGRPPGIKYGGTVPARFEMATMQALDAWAQKREVSRSEAIRRLVEIGLSAKQPVRPKASSGAARAAELAASVIEKHIDSSAPAEERETRKRRLLKGPSAFCDVRVDRAKKK